MRGRFGLLAVEVPAERRGDDCGQRHATTAFAALRLAFLKAKLSDAAYLTLHLERPGFEVDI